MLPLLSRLVVNALRHTPSGGSVTVSAAAKIERFWRADSARSRGSAEERLTGGTGLGLSLAQSLVRAQGGRIWVESTPGEGMVFRFTLPLTQRDH